MLDNQFRPGFYYDSEYEMVRLIRSGDEPAEFTAYYTDWITGVCIPEFQVMLRMEPIEVYNADGSVYVGQ